MVFHVVYKCGHNFHFVTNHAFDRQTDGRVPCSPVKMREWFFDWAVP